MGDAMLGTMSKKKANSSAASGPKDRGPVLFIRLKPEMEQALQAFIGAQDVEPDRSAVGLKALSEFLEKRGFWPPAGEK